MDLFRQDLRFAARTLRRNPGFTAIAALTLALGIGANTAIFSMVNALLLHPYAFPQLDQLVRVWENRGIDRGIDARFLSAGDASDIRGEAPSFAALTTYRCKDFNLSANGGVVPVNGCRVSANFFDVLGVLPAQGRAFLPSEETLGADQGVVVSYGFAQQYLGGASSALGNTIHLDGQTHTVVGVMPQGFSYPVPNQLWVPLALSPAARADRSQLTLESLARLKPGVSESQARAELLGISRRLTQRFPETNSGRTTEVLLLRKELYTFTLPLFLLLQAGAMLVLLLACANLANLLFARMIGRQKELAVRAALGASRSRLMRLFICETTLLSALAGGIAIAASFWSVNLLRTSISPGWTMWVPGWNGIVVNRAVLTFAVLTAVLVGIAFGFGAALHAGRGDVNFALKESGRGSMSRGKSRFRSSLVAAQVTFALVLLVCAGLVTQGFVRLAGAYQGFQARNVLKFEIRLSDKDYTDESRMRNFYDQFLTSVRQLPGVQQASLVTNPPASNVDNLSTFFTIEGRPMVNAAETPSADLIVSSPDYFRSLRIPLIGGRSYSEADNANAARVVVISRSMAERYWPAGEAIGRRIKLGDINSTAPWSTVAGIVEDVRQNWWNPAARPSVYVPFAQAPRRGMTVLLRTDGNPENYVSSLRALVTRIDPGVAINGINTLETEIADSIAIIKVMGVMMAVFGAIALVLSSVGVFGVLSEAVAQRTREIGIRIALGADRRDVFR
ncbi:MAG TPA: ABC transporter permease, partial [Candidatus Acidoferrales bacterium]|nr:ABC transporter permease [Candidatus Acidoferrales bacterium]